MKILRQHFVIISLMVFIFSCKEKEKKPETSHEHTKDSNLPANPQKFVNPYASVDNSPMDMSYYPVEYPKLKMANDKTPAPVARVIYSRPQLQGRKLFTNLLKYGETWRLGANEATEIQFYRDVMVMGKKVKKGRYILYCIPQPDKWTIVSNSNIDSWGLKQDSTMDTQKFDIPVILNRNSPSLEYFTIVFEKTVSGADMIMAWDEVVARLPINFQ